MTTDPTQPDDDFGTSVSVRYARRSDKVFPVTEIELGLLKWLPFWARIPLINRIIRESTFED